MRRHRVQDILRPYRPGLAAEPAVRWNDPLMRAIEQMLSAGLQEIAVIRHDRPVGRVNLAEALRRVGLSTPPLSADAELSGSCNLRR